eukprot:541943-Rhodomonas_salina.1
MPRMVVPAAHPPLRHPGAIPLPPPRAHVSSRFRVGHGHVSSSHAGGGRAEPERRGPGQCQWGQRV